MLLTPSQCVSVFGALFGFLLSGWHLPADPAKIVEVRKIWDQAPHNAFTDLIRFQDQWFCAFREGSAHVSPDGALRVITSLDGRNWESAARIASPTSDLRDAKLSLTPKGELMLSGAEAIPQSSGKAHQSLSWFSRDGRHWSESVEIGDRNFWLWRVTWHQGTAYSIGYGCGPEEGMIRLYQSQDGQHYNTLVKNLSVSGYPNETALIFQGNSALCLLRRDGQASNAFLGRAVAPFTEWKWQDLGVRVGGPQLLMLPDKRLVAAVRLYDGQARTALCWLDPKARQLTEFLKLPSGGDTSYPGLVWHNDQLWVSYYSSHEGKSAIYLATVEIPPTSSSAE